jgi:AraC-like DNA-binding protein
MSTPFDKTLPVMKFKPESPELNAIVGAPHLPPEFSHLKLANSLVDFNAYSWGRFITQEFHLDNYVIGWLRFEIDHPVILNPITDQMFQGLYCGIEGSIACELFRSGSLVLEEHKFGFYLVPANALNRAHFQPGIYTSLYISVNAIFLNEFISKNKKFTSIIEQARLGGKQADILHLNREARRIIQKLQHPPSDGISLKLQQNNLAESLLILYFNEVNQLATFPPSIQQAAQYILETIYDNISVQKIASHVKVPASKLSQLFKQHTGYTVVQFRQYERFKRACHLLDTTNLSIKEIAAECGYTHSPHLDRAFNRFANMSPIMYRNRNRNTDM